MFKLPHKFDRIQLVKTLKKSLFITFSFIVLLALFVNFGDFQTVEATGLNQNNSYLAQTRQRRELSPEQKAEVKKRADEQQRQISVQLAKDSKAREKRLIVGGAIGAFIFILLSIFIFAPLLIKSPWYIKPIIVIAIGITGFLLSFVIVPLILKALGI